MHLISSLISGLQASIFIWISCRSFFSTVRPLLSGHPSNKRPLSKVPMHLLVNCCIWYLYSTASSIKRPRPPFCCRKCIMEAPFSGQQVIFPSIWWIILNQIDREISWAKFFHILTVVPKGLRNLSTMFCTFSVHSQAEKILYIPTTLPANLMLGVALR